MVETCSLCEKPRFARDWCHMHWNRWRRNGDPEEVLLIWGDDRRRIMAKVDQSGGPDACWPWLGEVNYNGYGRASLLGRKRYAHSAVYELLVGPIPVGLHIDHQCHNADPLCVGGWACLHRRCVNPAHLEPSTRSQNMQRANARTA
jgi:hypothetical protein